MKYRLTLNRFFWLIGRICRQIFVIRALAVIAHCSGTSLPGLVATFPLTQPVMADTILPRFQPAIGNQKRVEYISGRFQLQHRQTTVVCCLGLLLLIRPGILQLPFSLPYSSVHFFTDFCSVSFVSPRRLATTTVSSSFFQAREACGRSTELSQ